MSNKVHKKLIFIHLNLTYNLRGKRLYCHSWEKHCIFGKKKKNNELRHNVKCPISPRTFALLLLPAEKPEHNVLTEHFTWGVRWILGRNSMPVFLRRELQKEVGSSLFTKNTENTCCQINAPNMFTYAQGLSERICPTEVPTILGSRNAAGAAPKGTFARIALCSAALPGSPLHLR